MLKKGIFRKVFGLTMTIAFVVGVIVLVVSTIRQTNSIKESLVEENKVLAEVAAKSIETGYLDFSWPFETLKKISDSEGVLFLWIVKPDGEIFLADEPEMQGKVINDPFLDTQKLVARDSAYQGQRIKLIVHPLEIEVGKKPWSLYLGASLKPVEIAQRKIIFTGIGIFALVIIFTALISFYFSKGVTQPLEQLRKGTEIIGKGNFKHRIKIKTGDEFEGLANTFNQMAGELQRSNEALKESEQVLKIKVKARTKELEELNQQLEARVEQRTKDLEQRIEELERFHKLTVGRELKMIELKKELRQAKEKIEKSKGRKEDLNQTKYAQ